LPRFVIAVHDYRARTFIAAGTRNGLANAFSAAGNYYNFVFELEIDGSDLAWYFAADNVQRFAGCNQGHTPRCPRGNLKRRPPTIS
jgi:hypothetical protein